MKNISTNFNLFFNLIFSFIFILGLSSFSINAAIIDEAIKKGQLVEADKIVEAEIAQNPNAASTWLTYAKLMLVKNDTQKAWAGLFQARKLMQASSVPTIEAEYYQIEGAWHFQKKIFDKAASSFKKSLTFDQHDLETNLWLACSWLAENKVQETTSLIAELRLNHPQDDRVNFLFKITQKSEQILFDLNKTQPNLLSPKIALIDFYIKQKKYAEAKRIVDAAQSFDVNNINSPLVVLSSQLSLLLNHPQEVLNNLNPLIQAHESYRLLSLLSSAYFSLGQFDQASLFFEKSLKAKEDQSVDLTQSAMMHIMQHNLSYLDQFIVNNYYQTQTSLTPSGLVKIAYYFKKNQLDNAKKEAKKFLQGYPNQAFSYDVVGRVHNATGEYAKAEAAFENAIKLNEKYLPARLHIAEVFIKQKKYHETRKSLTDTTKKFEANAQLFLLWSKLEEFEGERDVAKKWLEKASSLEQNLEPGLEWVSFYLRQNRPDLALLLAENLTKLHGHDIRLLNLLGGLYLEKTQQYPQAVDIYEKLAKFLPDSPGVIHNLAKSYTLTAQPEKAIALLERYAHDYP